ncbi:DUF3019 domain-containing protein [Catenovulum sp. SM1970]|uniref:DUF3019 domain-containing protein n=1 Tax=Marinifaba aquimaris TaxID=2741323 RepID=UPI00157290D8|nr:DUF3019 domain-containing protein [Marinifaba aquimaris]NTS77020.1 DUF3019 domain-containing protein [Marinifaba aquimaris]
MIKNIITVFAVLIATCTLPVLANNSGYIELRPKACAVDSNKQCVVEIEVVFFADIHACAYQTKHKLACTENKESTTIYAYEGDTAIRFDLIDSKSQKSIDYTELTLVELAKYKRRQRNPWSLF